MIAPLVTRIVVTGSESTGKTQLASELAAHFGVLWVTEQARVYAQRVNRLLTTEDVSAIASEQITAEDHALTESARNGYQRLVLDTDLLSTVVYARHYYGSCPQWIEAEARARLGDRYLLCDIDLPWTADGIRDRPASRDRIQGQFVAVLLEFGASVCLVAGAGEARLRSALACLTT